MRSKFSRLAPGAWAVWFLAGPPVWAFDVDPSKKTVDPKFINPSGKRFDIFSGDPERIQKVNRIERDEFDVSVVLKPETLMVHRDPMRLQPEIQIGMMVVSRSKRPKTFSFPDAQRIDVAVKDAGGGEIYRWSANKQFVQAIGTSMVMPGERLVFMVDVPVKHWKQPARPGSYTVDVALANHPEFTATTNLVVATGTAQQDSDGQTAASDGAAAARGVPESLPAP